MSGYGIVVVPEPSKLVRRVQFSLPAPKHHGDGFLVSLGAPGGAARRQRAKPMGTDAPWQTQAPQKAIAGGFGRRAAVAQLVEHLIEAQGVGGSKPSRRTRKQRIRAYRGRPPGKTGRRYSQICAGVVELVDTPDSESGGAILGGSSPSTRTIYASLRAALP